ncbi:MAG TPA: AraC family transcriptional regulator [Bryobacteraceae bacterium]|nr:AraC family transcriptional regulator [Bryobacteraceae bacterium]
MAKIAVDLERALATRSMSGEEAGETTGRLLARGPGWSVEDVLCTCGPRDQPYEEQHSLVCIAIIAAGSFLYRSSGGRDMMTPGSLLLGSPGQAFECGHDHTPGDRCISFRYDAGFFEDTFDAPPNFRMLRVPAMRSLSPIVARACSILVGDGGGSWEELSLMLADRVLTIESAGWTPAVRVPIGAEARVAKVIRKMEQHPDEDWPLERLAGEGRLSRYHFIRTFEALTGSTPHQYLLRTRLREAAMRLAGSSSKILEIALDCGFGDVSNFNREFRAEFGVSPRGYRNGV